MSEDQHYDELNKFYEEQNDFNKFVEMMDERIRRLEHIKCIKCNSVGLEAVSINNSICNNCHTIHNE